MAEQTAPAHTMPTNGTFCWNELASTDAEAAKKFYTELLGWTLKESNAVGMVYNEVVVGGQHIGGMYQMGPELCRYPVRGRTAVLRPHLVHAADVLPANDASLYTCRRRSTP